MSAVLFRWLCPNSRINRVSVFALQGAATLCGQYIFQPQGQAPLLFLSISFCRNNPQILFRIIFGIAIFVVNVLAITLLHPSLTGCLAPHPYGTSCSHLFCKPYLRRTPKIKEERLKGEALLMGEWNNARMFFSSVLNSVEIPKSYHTGGIDFFCQPIQKKNTLL